MVTFFQKKGEGMQSGRLCVLLLLCAVASSQAIDSLIEVAGLYNGGTGLLRQRWTINPSSANDSYNTVIGIVRYSDDYNFFVPASPATAVSETGPTVYTMHLSDGWRVCRWIGQNEPVCADQAIAPVSSGTPTSMVYVGNNPPTLIIAFPEVGDILACAATGNMAPWSRKWATGLATPASLAYDPTADVVYVALLNGDKVVRYDASSGPIDPGNAPFLSVQQPRFILCNLGGDANTLSFAVMSMAAEGAELFFYDRNGNSVGSVVDSVGQWVCDEPGEDENVNDIKRVVSIALDATLNKLYVTREGNYGPVDEYDISNAIPDDTDTGTSAVTDTLVRRAIGLLTTGGKSVPVGLVDSYQISLVKNQFQVYLECSATTSGATLETPLGLWLCGGPNEPLILLYSNRTVYSLEIVEDTTPDPSVCFARYLYVLDSGDRDSIIDTYLADQGSALYVLHASGRVVRIDRACEAVLSAPPRSDLNVTLSATLIAVPGQDFIVRGGVPCVATRYGIACSGGQAPSAPGTPVCGGTLEATTVRYLESYDMVLVSGTIGQQTYVEGHTYVNDTYTQEDCVGPFDNLYGFEFLVDTHSGVFGWLDKTTGTVHEYDPDRQAVTTFYNRTTLRLPADAGAFVLSDPIGQHGRWPKPADTVAPTRKPHRTGMSRTVFYIGLAFLLCILLLTCVGAVLCVVMRRRNRSIIVSGSHVHTEGSESTTYNDSYNNRESSRSYLLPAGFRRFVRKTFCCCLCCYGYNSKLRCCSSCLGGKLDERARNYHNMDEPSRHDQGEHDELPETHYNGGINEHPNQWSSTDGADTDSRVGGAPMENIELKE